MGKDVENSVSLSTIGETTAATGGGGGGGEATATAAAEAPVLVATATTGTTGSAGTRVAKICLVLRKMTQFWSAVFHCFHRDCDDGNESVCK